jgi:hypothetical protein
VKTDRSDLDAKPTRSDRFSLSDHMAHVRQTMPDTIAMDEAARGHGLAGVIGFA